jgi:N-acetylglucosaminyldiphosphoundecaprenol N-acetyl-beta-D-mannosaminyltransferase
MQVKESESRWGDVGAQVVTPAPSSVVASLKRPPKPRLPVIELDGVRIHAIDERACIEHILNELAAGRGGFVVTPNVDHLRRCRRDVNFAALVTEASLVVADGMPLVWASRLQATPLPGRVAGSDLITTLSGAAASQGRSIFLLGGVEGTAEAAANILRTKFPELRIAGTFYPAPGFENDENAMRKIVETLQSTKPDIVYVALGSPKQEQVIDQIRRTLPGAWWLGVGVSFSFLCGDVRRAPLWMRKTGLEWFHRMMQEPRRLIKRYLIVGVPYASAMLTRASFRGIPNRLFGKRSAPEIGPEAEASAIFFGPGGSPLAPTGAEDSAESVNEIATRLAAASAPMNTPAVNTTQLNTLPMNTPPPPSESSQTFDAVHSTSSSNVAWRLRGLVLLGGGVRSTTLAASLDRNVLDLPVGKGKTLLTRWLDEAAAVAQLLEMEHLPVRLLLDNNAIAPISAAEYVSGTAGVRYQMERDAAEYRGTGGLLANIAVDYDDDDLILVGNAAQLLLDPLPALVTSLKKTRGTVGLIGHRDGEPSNLMLITCRALRVIPKVGFVDMKEQALPIIAGKHDVRVVQCRRPTGLTIRTLSDYVSALRALHQPVRAIATDPWAESWRSTFSIVENGATVAPSARIHDSVILSGANVESGAVVVRSVVAGTVRHDRKIVDECVGPSPKGPAGGFEVVGAQSRV